MAHCGQVEKTGLHKSLSGWRDGHRELAALSDILSIDLLLHSLVLKGLSQSL